MDIICEEFKDDVESFKEYLKSLNKTFGSAGEGLRVYYSPVVINRLVGLLYYFNIAVQHMHVVPKLSIIQAAQATAWGRLYQDSIKTKETDIGQDDVKIPQFKGHNNWIEFKQKLVLKISLIKSVTGFTLDYIVDTIEREHKSAWSRKGEVEEYDPSDLESMKTKFIFFGEVFKKDNIQFWKIFGTQSP